MKKLPPIRPATNSQTIDCPPSRKNHIIWLNVARPMQQATTSVSEPLHEFVRIPMFTNERTPAQEAFMRRFHEAHGIPPLEHFLELANKRLDEILKPRPFVKPIVKRKKKHVEPTSSATLEGNVAVPTTCSETPAIPTSPNLIEPAENTNSNSLTGASPDTSEQTCTFYSGSDLQSHGEPRTTTGSISNGLLVEANLKSPEPCTSNNAASPDKQKTHTARKSTASRRRNNPSKQEPKIQDCQLVLLDLAKSNLGDVVERLISNEHDKTAELKCRTELQKRSESTDSGLVTDEEPQPPDPQPIQKTVPPLKVSIPWTYGAKNNPVQGKSSAVKRPRSKPPPKEGSRKRKKTEQDDRSYRKPKTGGATKASHEESPRPSTSKAQKFSLKNFSKKIPTSKKPQPPSLIAPRLKGIEKSSIDIAPRPPPTRQLESALYNNRVIKTVKPSSHYLLGTKDINSNTVNKIALPVDVVATSDFDLPTIEVAPLCTKRSKEPPQLSFFLPYGEEEKNCCISCNKVFNTKQELAKHKLAHHSEFGC